MRGKKDKERKAQLVHGEKKEIQTKRRKDSTSFPEPRRKKTGRRKYASGPGR